ncbi:MAG: hypothetical protein Q4D81_09565 [Eubacteriales bacterium]|nr:hypothetical protein [Eubacteriales bacterium]
MEKKRRFRSRFAAAILAMIFAVGMIAAGPAVRAEAAVKKPANCRFVQWMNTQYTKCQIKWDPVSGIDGYETSWSWTDGKHQKIQSWKAPANGIYMKVPNNRVSLFKVRAYKKSGTTKTYSEWSNTVFITPSPTLITWKWSYKNGVPNENFTWNRVIGTSGYRIYLSMDRKKWVLAKTINKSTLLKATITKYNGKNMKQGKKDEYKYYFRIISLRKVNGKMVEAPKYSATWCPGYFYFTK